VSSPRQNLELKARCPDLDAVRERVRRLGARDGGVEMQTDTYFRVPNGRLKLREWDGKPAELIWYARPDNADARTSTYLRVPVPAAALLKTALTSALGQWAQVRKRRHIYFWHNVRIHLDEVAGLGTFLEFEAVLSPTEDEVTARVRLDQLCRDLAVADGDRIAGSYSNLMLAGEP
jgi:predicted adenylyl cyclase CyaB